MTFDYEAVAVAMDAFPHWTEEMRAKVLEAVELAPDEVINGEDEFDIYFESDAYDLWWDIRRYPILESGDFTPDLKEASGHISDPTKHEILSALQRGARMIQ